MYYIQNALLLFSVTCDILMKMKEEDFTMTYTKQFNRVRNEWWIFRVTATGADLVKIFKTERAADSWIRKQS